MASPDYNVVRNESSSAWDKIDAARTEVGLVEDDVPGTAFTLAEYANRYVIPRKTAESQLVRLVELGKLQFGRCMARAANGRRTLMRFYWPA